MISTGDADNYSIRPRHLCHLFPEKIISDKKLVKVTPALLYSKFEDEYDYIHQGFNLTSHIPTLYNHYPKGIYRNISVPYMIVPNKDNTSSFLIMVDTRKKNDDLKSFSVCQCYTMDDDTLNRLELLEKLKDIPEYSINPIAEEQFTALCKLKNEILETIRTRNDRPNSYAWFETLVQRKYANLPSPRIDAQKRIIPHDLQNKYWSLTQGLSRNYRSLFYNVVQQHNLTKCALKDVLKQNKSDSFTWGTTDLITDDHMYTFSNNELSCNHYPNADSVSNWYTAMGVCLVQKLIESSTKDVSAVIEAYNKFTNKVKEHFTECVQNNGFGSNPLGLVCARWMKETRRLFPAELIGRTYNDNFWAHKFVNNLDRVPSYSYSWKNISQRQRTPQSLTSPYSHQTLSGASSSPTEPPVFYEWLSEKIDNKITNSTLELKALAGETFRVNTCKLDEFELNGSSAVIELYKLLDIAKCRNTNYTTPVHVLRVLQYVEHLRDSDPSLDIWTDLVDVDAEVKTAVEKPFAGVRKLQTTVADQIAAARFAAANPAANPAASNSVETETQNKWSKWSKLIDEYKYTISYQEKQLMKRIIFNVPHLLNCETTEACLDYLFEYFTYANRVEMLRMRLIRWTDELYEPNDFLCSDFYEIDQIQLRPSKKGKLSEVFQIEHLSSAVYDDYEKWIENANETYQEYIKTVEERNEEIKEINRKIEEENRKGTKKQIEKKQLQTVPRNERLEPYKLPKQYSDLGVFEPLFNRITGVGAHYVNIDSKSAFFKHFIEPLKTTVNVVDFIQYCEVCISDACTGKNIQDNAVEEDGLTILPTSLHGDTFLNTKDHHQWISMMSTSPEATKSQLHNLMRAVIMDDKKYHIRVRSEYILSCVKILVPTTRLDSYAIRSCIQEIDNQPIRAQKHEMINHLLEGRISSNTGLDSANHPKRLLKDYTPHQSHIEHTRVANDFLVGDSGDYFRQQDPPHDYIYAACQEEQLIKKTNEPASPFYEPQFYITFGQSTYGIQYQQNDYELLTEQRSIQHLPFMAMIPYCVPYLIGHRNHNQYIVCIYLSEYIWYNDQEGRGKQLRGWHVYSVSSNLLTFEFKNVHSAAKGVRALMALCEPVGCTPFLEEMLKGYQSQHTLRTHCLSRPGASDVFDVHLFDEVRQCIQRCYDDINKATRYFDALTFTSVPQLKDILRRQIKDKYDEKGIDDSVLDSFCNDVRKCTFDSTVTRTPLTEQTVQTIVEDIRKLRNTLCTRLLTVYDDKAGFASMDTRDITVCTNILILNTLLQDVYSLKSLTERSSDARDSRDLKLLCKGFDIYEHLWFGKQKSLQPSRGRRSTQSRRHSDPSHRNRSRGHRSTQRRRHSDPSHPPVLTFTGTRFEFLFQVLFGFLVHKRQWETYTEICNNSQKSAQLYQFMMSRGKSSVISPLLVLHNLQTLYRIKKDATKPIGIDAIDPTLLRYLHDNRFDTMSLMEIRETVLKDNVRWPWRSKTHTHDVELLDLFNQQLESILAKKKQPPNRSMVYAIVPTQLTTQVADGFCALQWYFGIGGTSLHKICPTPHISTNIFIDDVFYHKSPPIQYPPDTSHYGTLLTKSDADMKELFFEKEVDFFEKAVFLIDEFDSMYDPLQSNYNVVDEISSVELLTNDHVKYIVYQSCKKVYTERAWTPPSIHVVEGRSNVSIPDFVKTFEQNNVSFVKFVDLQLQSVDSLEKKIQYGLTKDKDNLIRTRTAIPYLRKDTPMEGSSFSSEVITLALSTLYRCDSDVTATFEIRFDEYDLMFLIKCGQIQWLVELFLYTLLNTPTKKKEFYELQYVNNAKGLSVQQRELLRRCCVEINDMPNVGDRLGILVKLVQNMNDFKVKKKIANMSFIDILGIRGLHFQTGFTGTVNVELVQYPQLHNSDEHRHFDANIRRDYDETLNVYTAFTESIDDSNELFTDFTTPEDIYEKVSTLDYHMLVDAVGVFKEGDNRHVIDCIYKKDCKNRITRQYVYLTDTDDKKIFDPEGPLTEKDCTGKMPETTFFYYSQKHIVGIDFKQQRNMRGLLIVSRKTTYTNMAQAIYRARKLNQGHIMDIVVWPDEADESENGTPTPLDQNTLYHMLRDNDESARNTRSDLLHAQTVKHIGRKWLSEHAADHKKATEKRLSRQNKSKYRLFRFIELIYQYCTSSLPPLHKKWYLETAHDPVYLNMTGVPPGSAGHDWLYKDLQAITVQFKHIIDQDESLRKQMTVSETDKSLDKMFFKQGESRRSSLHRNRGGSPTSQRRSSRKSSIWQRQSLRKSSPQRAHSEGSLPIVKDSHVSRLDRFEINGQWEVMKLLQTIKDWYTTTKHPHAQTIKDICDQHLKLLNLVRNHSNSNRWYQKVCEHIVHTLYDSTDLEHKFYPWITEADFYQEFKRVFSINANSMVALQAMDKRWSQLKADTKHTRRNTSKQRRWFSMLGRRSTRRRSRSSSKRNQKDQERKYIEAMGKFLIKEKTKIYSQDKTMRLCLGVTGGGLGTEQQQQQQQQKQVKRQVQLEIQKPPSKPWSFPKTMDALALQTFNSRRALESMPEETIELSRYSEDIDSVDFVTYKTSNGAYSYGTIEKKEGDYICIYGVLDGKSVNIPRTDVQVKHRLVASYALLHWDRRPFNVRNIERYVDRKMYDMLAPMFGLTSDSRFWNQYEDTRAVMSWPSKGYTPLSDIQMVAIPCPITGVIYWVLTTARCASYMPRRGFHFNVNEKLTNGHYLTDEQKEIAKCVRIPRYFQQMLNGMPAMRTMKDHTTIKNHYHTILTLQTAKFGWPLNGYKYTAYTTQAIKALIKAKAHEFKTFQSNGYTNDCVRSVYYRTPYGAKVNINEFGDEYPLFEKTHVKKA